MFIATIILVATLTTLIFTLTIVAFSTICKSEKREIELGNKDAEIKEDIEKEKKRSSKALNITSSIFGGLIALSLLAASITAITYKAQGEQFAINNQVSLVIVSDSMDGFYNETWKLELPEDAEKDQFKIGDIVTFEKITEEEELIPFEVYGYKNSKGQIITHRYIKTIDDKLVFRGDNTGGYDSRVDRSQVVLHYTDHKIPHVGMFVLFSQSGFGLYSFISVICVYVLAEAYSTKYERMIKARIKYLNEQNNVIINQEEDSSADISEVNEENDKVLTENQVQTPPAVEDSSDKRLVEFTTKYGQKVSFYVKKKEKKVNEK